MRARRLIAALAVCALPTSAASADFDNAPAGGPVLHEYVAPPRAGDPGSRTPADDEPRTFGGSPRAGKNPAALKSDRKLIPEPPKSLAPGQREPVHGTDVAAADRDTSAPPDRLTGADGTLYYTEVFDPAVVPFKRMTVLDSVDDAYVMRLFDGRVHEIAVGGQTQSDRDVFWGSLLVQLEPNQHIAIPSTAPDMRILSWETEPPLASLSFGKDGADNYYVRSDDPQAKGTFRLVFLSDAPASYFAPQVPRGYAIADAAASGLGRPVPARARAAAAQVLGKLGVDSATPLDIALDRLVEYFRRFEAGDPPPTTDDIYLDLALARRGVCRHRSFAFMITANALGIPARFVTNEAHAFAEVWVPERGWLRVDLGGAAQNLDVANASDKQMYRPRAEDGFPQPSEYTDNYTQLRGTTGLTQEQIDQRRGDGPGRGGDGQDGTDPTLPPGSRDPLAPTPGTGLPAPPPETYVGKTVTLVQVDDLDAEGFRGDAVFVSGIVTDDTGIALAGLPVRIWLAPSGRGGDGARMLGEAVTGVDGRYQSRLDLPRDLSLGRHEVFASTPGDKTHQPALSR